MFSGTVGSGKTHNLRAFTHAIPPGWRLVTIEDMPELTGLPHANVVNLFYSKGGQSVANTRAEDLVEAALRMGMDGLLNQELRDEAAYAYLNVLASGHWGMTTTHADSAGQARDRIRGLIKKHPAGRHLADADVMTALHRVDRRGGALRARRRAPLHRTGPLRPRTEGPRRRLRRHPFPSRRSKVMRIVIVTLLLFLGSGPVVA